jgi:hypothetical protein
MTTPEQDYTTYSPAELRKLITERGLDAAGVDMRKKTELVELLKAGDEGRGNPFKSAAPPPRRAAADTVVEIGAAADVMAAAYAGTVIDDAHGAVKQAQGTLSGTLGPAEPLSGVLHDPLEPLTPDDLVFVDRNRVRVHMNSFPVTVDGKRECRLVIAQVPGEPGVMAAGWWKRAGYGPALVAGVQRLLSWDGESSFVTEDGVEHGYVKSEDCGCGNRLKNWRPWTSPIKMVQVPKT